MNTAIKTQACPECGAVMRLENREDLIQYGLRSRTIMTLGWWCTKCGEAILTGEPLLALERAFQQLKAEVDGVLNSTDV